MMSAMLTLIAATLCATGALSVTQPMRNVLSGALAVSGVVEALMRLRFLGES